MDKKGSLKYLVEQLKRTNENEVNEENIWYAVRGAINPALLISNLAEALRIPAGDTATLLSKYGLGDLVAQNRLSEIDDADSSDALVGYQIADKCPTIPFAHLFSVTFSPNIDRFIELSPSQHEAVQLLMKSIKETIDEDPFISLYRNKVREYHDQFISTDGKLIEEYIKAEFPASYPRYLINSGIGANEQFNHFVAHLNNSNPERNITWIITDSPRQLFRIPEDATIENTLFMEFSRSGKTEETVKIHEYTPKNAKRIVFANSGPLREIGLRDHNLVLDLPDKVSGRFGRNKTPILLAPMHVAKMDTQQFWDYIGKAISEFDLSSDDCLALLIGKFIYLYQEQRKINHIYLGCNDDVLRFSVNELLQFWNEGVNKNGNDIMSSAYFGLLRDSHATIEGLLGNHQTKMAIFLLRDCLERSALPNLTQLRIDPIDEAHEGLCFGDEEIILAEANYERFSEVMPSIKLTTIGDLTLEHAAVLGQLWADVTFVYSRMKHLDPGSNPEVKYVRDRAARLLAEFAAETRSAT